MSKNPTGLNGLPCLSVDDLIANIVAGLDPPLLVVPLFGLGECARIAEFLDPNDLRTVITEVRHASPIDGVAIFRSRSDFEKKNAPVLSCVLL